MTLLKRCSGRCTDLLRALLRPFALSILVHTASAVVSVAQPPVPVLQDSVMRATIDLVTDTTIELDRLEQLLGPLRQGELEAVAEIWIGHVQARAMELNLEPGQELRSDGTLKALVERTQLVVLELDERGGDAARIEEYRVYLEAASGIGRYPGIWAILRRGFLPAVLTAVPAVLVVLLLVYILFRLDRLLRRGKRKAQFRFWRPVIMLVVTGIGLVVVVLLAPMNDASQGQLITLVGFGMTAVIAISSTTLVANAMSGVILRSVGNFKPNDWLRVGEQFGRVTKLGLFSTEIQTEERDLTTLPNSYLITNPVKVVLDSGTYVAVSLSLGYENSVSEILELLETAAKETVLPRADMEDIRFKPEDCYAQVHELGDFSITYRAIGYLEEVEQLLLMRSAFRRRVVYALHESGIEIVSPIFMNQRALAPKEKVIPEPRKLVTDTGPSEREGQPTERQFEKAEKAGEEQRRDRLAELDTRMAGEKAELAKDPANMESRQSLERLSLERDELDKQGESAGS